MYYIDEKTMNQIKELKEQINKVLETIPAEEMKKEIEKCQELIKGVHFYTEEEWNKMFKVPKSLI